MENLYSVFFGFPSIVIILLLSFIGIYQTIKDFITAIKTQNYAHIVLVIWVTVVAILIGWVLGSFV